MADFATHDLFGRTVIGGLPPYARRLCSYYRKAFNWGLQGPDILMAHHFMTGGDALSELGVTMHMQHIDALFAKMAELCGENKEGALARCMRAYFYGFLCHYSLDATIHPYVYAMIEKMIGEGPEEDDNMLHMQIETDIDTVLYEKVTGSSINTFHVADDFGFGIDFRSKGLMYAAIRQLYLPVLRQVYGYPAQGKEIDESIDSTARLRAMQYQNVHLSVLIADTVSKSEVSKKRTLAMIKYKKPSWDVLNAAHASWLDLQGNAHTEDIAQIFEEAGEKAISLIGQYEKMFSGGETGELHFQYDFEGELTSSPV